MCRQLGFPGDEVMTYYYARFGWGNGSIVLRNLQCTGSELFITDCPNDGLVINVDRYCYNDVTTVRCVAEGKCIKTCDSKVKSIIHRYFSIINSCPPVLHTQVGLVGTFHHSVSCLCR